MLESTKETILLLILGLLSFGGATGRIIIGLSLFDILLCVMCGIALLKQNKTTLKFKKKDIYIYGILIAITLYGGLRSELGVKDIEYDYLITEIRFFVYLPMVYYISTRFKINIEFFEKILPYILVGYIILWAIFLTPGGPLYNFFNSEVTQSIGDRLRVSGPNILILVPLLLILIKRKGVKLPSLLMYIVLVILIFFKTGRRTYLVFNLMPVFYLIFKKRKNIGILFLSVILILVSIFFLKEVTSKVFFERFTNIANVTEDSSFMYRVLNISEMLSRLKGVSLWLGYGIGSNYDILLKGGHQSYYLDNSFITLVYKIGITGLVAFMSIFAIGRKFVPKDTYYFEIASLLAIGLITYHIILNPVFVFGYFIILNYYRNLNKKSIAFEARNNKYLY